MHRKFTVFGKFYRFHRLFMGYKLDCAWKIPIFARGMRLRVKFDFVKWTWQAVNNRISLRMIQYLNIEYRISEHKKERTNTKRNGTVGTTTPFIECEFGKQICGFYHWLTRTCDELNWAVSCELRIEWKRIYCAILFPNGLYT